MQPGAALVRAAHAINPIENTAMLQSIARAYYAIRLHAVRRRALAYLNTRIGV